MDLHLHGLNELERTYEVLVWDSRTGAGLGLGLFPTCSRLPLAMFSWIGVPSDSFSSGINNNLYILSLLPSEENEKNGQPTPKKDAVTAGCCERNTQISGEEAVVPLSLLTVRGLCSCPLTVIRTAGIGSLGTVCAGSGAICTH